MAPKLIALENRSGPFRMVFQRVMRMVPDRDKNDKRLQRMLAFRVINDGEAATASFLIRKIRFFVHLPAPKSFYEFLVDGEDHEFPPSPPLDGDPPGAA
jgi:hypothetical protein